MQLYVEVDDDSINAVYKVAESDITEAVDTIEEYSGNVLDVSYQSEFNPMVKAWIKSIAASLEKGVALLIDYGYSAAEYYHPQRHMGTLTCHYQHRSHANPFWYPGLQDITAFVDFSDVAYAADAVGMNVSGYTTQAAFLFASGLEQLHQEAMANGGEDDVTTQIALSQQIKTLTLPSEMGERFKVIALTKEIDESLVGFSLQDFRSKL
jgi:SAM-dependent MidA family methyltransferase